MGKKTKVGKARRDKFYQLAKETGYRSRAAFKLIQLNRKYEFLQKAKVVVDLCAAPGGWLQVVEQNTPVSSLIIGIDLVSIKPIHNCITFQEDITTEKCKQTIKQELKTWKADVFLNDGAPNIGKSWVHDSYQQVVLTLAALKLATSFLKKGGWFVTKVFRSKDYFSLLWVFQQLFHEVHATKPKASRNESAEIFVVCQGFTAPERIDAKFLDSKYVFKDVDDEPTQMLDLIHPEKKRRHRGGYPEGDHTLYHTKSISEFVFSDNYMNQLATTSEFLLDDKKISSHPETTEEIKECLKDIKVLGKKDFRNLIAWRKKLRSDLCEEVEKPEVEQLQPEPNSEDEEMEIKEKLAEMEEEERKTLKRKLRKTRKQKSRLHHMMDMKMIVPNSQDDLNKDVSLFNLKKLKSKKELNVVEAGDQTTMDADLAKQAEESDDEDLDKLAKQSVSYDREIKDYMDPEDLSELEYESDPDLEDEYDDDAQDEKDLPESDKNPLLVDLETPAFQAHRMTNSWFTKDVFADLEDDDDEDMELEHMTADYRRRGGTVLEQPWDIYKRKQKSDKLSKGKKEKKKTIQPMTAEEYDSDSGNASQSASSDEEIQLGENEDSNSDSDSNSDYDINEDWNESGKGKTKVIDKHKEKDGFEIVPINDSAANIPQLDAVGLAIGSEMVKSQKRRREIIDGAYHRYMFDDENLPEWFTADETKHTKRLLPVTKETIQEYKLKERAINAAPIKKIAQAKARRKRKEMKKLEKARKKAEAVTDAVDVSDKEKWQQIKTIYKKAGLLTKKKKEVTYVVAKKGTGKRVHRPAGVSGRFKVVDGRMKKDSRGKKAKDQLKGKKSQKKGRRKR